MPAIYRNEGIRLQYPENWTLHDARSAEGERQLVIEAPDGAMMTFVFQSRGSDGLALAQYLVDCLQKEFPDLESLPAREELMGFAGEGFDCEVFYLDLLISAWVRVFAAPRHVIGVMAQAESRDFARYERVFKAIVASALE